MSRHDNYPDDIRSYDNDPRSPFYEEPPICAGCGDSDWDEDGYCTYCGTKETTDDPTPYCNQCGAWRKDQCDCLPIAENE